MKLKQNHDKIQDEQTKSVLKAFIVEYEIASKIHAKYQYLFNLLFEVKSRRSEEIEKAFWIIIMHMKQLILSKNSKTVEVLLLIISVLLRSLKKFPVSKGILYNDSDCDGPSSYNRLLSMMLKNLAFAENSANKESIEGYILQAGRELEKLDLKEFLDFENTGSDEDEERETLINHRVIIRMMREYEMKLGSTQFNECLLLNVVQSDKSPIKCVDVSNPMELLKNPLIRQKLEFTDLSINAKLPFFKDDKVEDSKPVNKSNISMDFVPHPQPINPHINSPIGMTNNFQAYTPITRVVNMSKWVLQYINNFNPKNIESVLTSEGCSFGISEITKKIDEFSAKMFELIRRYSVRLLIKPQDFNSLCLKLIDGLIKKNQLAFKLDASMLKQIIQIDIFLKAIVTIGFEIVLYVENTQDIFFYKIAECIQLDVFHLLKIINPIMTFDLMNVRVYFTYF